MNLFEGKMRRTFVERGSDRLATAFDFPNDNQRQAVSWNDGPLLVLAGPGSGKTWVLTFRIARILEESDDASALALTFTNKAAAEMRERVEQLPGRRADRVHLCTFHSFAVDVLRQHGSHLGLRPDFSLLTQDEDRIAILEDLVAGLPDESDPLPTDRWNLLRFVDRLFAESYDGGEKAASLARVAAGLEIHLGRRRTPVSWRDYITVAPEVCQGKGSIAGTRVLVTVVLNNLAVGRCRTIS